MAKYGKITRNGIEIPTISELMDDLEEELKKQPDFGENIDFSDDDPLKQLCYPFMIVARDLYEFGQEVFFSSYPDFAEGNSLAYLMAYQGTRKKQATKACHIVRFYGSSGTKIPSGYIVATEGLINFLTISENSIKANGYVDIEVEAEKQGSIGNVPIGSITNIVNPIIGLTSIENIQQTKEGLDKETDPQARTRYKEIAKGGTGSSTDAIRSRLLNVTGVKSAIVRENEEDVEIDGIPPHSLYSLVQGGSDEDIARAIMEKKAGGIKTFGSIEVILEDSQKIPKKIYFNRPATQDIYIKITLSKTNTYPTDGDQIIKNVVIEYVNNLSIGEDVIIYKIITAISNLQLAGIEDITVELSQDGVTYTSSNIVIEREKVAITAEDKVVVQ